jgi:hypothetical protein
MVVMKPFDFGNCDNRVRDKDWRCRKHERRRCESARLGELAFSGSQAAAPVF